MQRISMVLAVSTMAALSLGQAEARVKDAGIAAAAAVFDQTRKCKRGHVWDADTRKCVRRQPRGSF